MNLQTHALTYTHSRYWICGNNFNILATIHSPENRMYTRVLHAHIHAYTYEHTHSTESVPLLLLLLIVRSALTRNDPRITSTMITVDQHRIGDIVRVDLHQHGSPGTQSVCSRFSEINRQCSKPRLVHPIVSVLQFRRSSVSRTRLLDGRLHFGIKTTKFGKIASTARHSGIKFIALVNRIHSFPILL